MTTKQYEEWRLRNGSNKYPTRYYASKFKKEGELVIELQDNSGYICISYEDYYQYYLRLPKCLLKNKQ